MVTFEEFRKKALSNQKVKEEYENLKPIFKIKKTIISIKIKKN